MFPSKETNFTNTRSEQYYFESGQPAVPNEFWESGPPGLVNNGYKPCFQGRNWGPHHYDQNYYLSCGTYYHHGYHGESAYEPEYEQIPYQEQMPRVSVVNTTKQSYKTCKFTPINGISPTGRKSSDLSIDTRNTPSPTDNSTPRMGSPNTVSPRARVHHKTRYPIIFSPRSINNTKEILSPKQIRKPIIRVDYSKQLSPKALDYKKTNEDTEHQRPINKNCTYNGTSNLINQSLGKVVGVNDKIVKPWCKERFRRSFEVSNTPRKAITHCLPCRNMITTGCCPYKNTCKYIHDYDISCLEYKNLRTGQKPKNDDPYDSFFWPASASTETYIPLFDEKISFKVLGIFSLWYHFYDCVNVKKSPEIEKIRNDATKSRNYVTGEQRLPIFIMLSLGVSLDE
jgi:hypothetical protein